MTLFEELDDDTRETVWAASSHPQQAWWMVVLNAVVTDTHEWGATRPWEHGLGTVSFESAVVDCSVETLERLVDATSPEEVADE